MHQLPQDFSFENIAKNIEHLIMYDIKLTPSDFSKNMVPNYKLKCLEILKCKTSVSNLFSEINNLFPALSSLSLVDNSFKFNITKARPKFSTVRTLHIDTPSIMYFKDKSGKFEANFFKKFPSLTHLKANLKHRKYASKVHISECKSAISTLTKFINLVKVKIEKITIMKKARYVYAPSVKTMTKGFFECEYDTHTPLIQL